jgi:glycosyltransferase involved in cell wall biosynthesis
MLSVLMSVYRGECADYLDQSLASLEAQTRPADEVLIVKDGPLGADLECVIDRYAPRLPIAILQLETNQGLGPALRAGVERCSFDLIARMDSDDVCAPQRFEHQLEFLAAHPEVDVLGGCVREFESDPRHFVSVRRLPRDHSRIRSFAKTRNPMNHMTVMFRKSAVLAVESYRHAVGLEDYDLWVRMLMHGARFHNLEEALVYARTGNGMLNRRGGLAYFRREAALFWSFKESGFLSTWEFLVSTTLRLPIRLLPESIRGLVYRGLLRAQ